MQIKSVNLYNSEGDIRRLDFRVGAVNIITGQSNTGKSTILQIVDYCLGRSSYEIYAGVTRDTVAWYSVIFQIANTDVFIAKPAPLHGKTKQTQSFYFEDARISLPALTELVAQTDDSDVIKNLSRLVRSKHSNANDANDVEVQFTYKTTLDYAKPYLFQEKTVIANNQVLFHRQSEYLSEIKETLPFFLGTVRENDLRFEQELVTARRDLQNATRKLRQEERSLADIVTVGQSLLQEAKEVGLIDVSVVAETTEDLLAILRPTQEWHPAPAPVSSNETLPSLRDELYAIRRELRQKQEEINSVRSFIRETEGYSRAATEQLMRLESINLFGHQDGLFDTACPLCNSTLENPPPTIIEMRTALNELENNLEGEKRERPQLDAHLKQLEQELEQIKLRISDKRQEVELALAGQAENENLLQQIMDGNSLTERVVGRISLYLRMLKPVEPSSQIHREIDEAQLRVNTYQDIVNENQVAEGNQSRLRAIGAQMTEWARILQLEHLGFYSLDVDRLTVTVDKPNGEIVAMERMGGRSNWLGCHLITLLALHQHFVGQSAPVPNFIFLDQPAQVYFPSVQAYESLEGIPTSLADAGGDAEAANRMFNFLFDVCESLAPHFQIIILEHANISDNLRFQRAIIDDGVWKGGKALIPESWINFG